ncbi:MAG: 16S rRNA (adenine(1518)-N(6)/adenine(1519)-N(6))-dimethyltransferase RsmA [Burkholderiales bacterium]
MVKHQARKRFGQNFLVDEVAIAAIVSAIHPSFGECLVEIGPGLGALTRPLLAAAGTLHTIEIDRDLAQALQQEFGERINLHAVDVLQFDFAALGDGLRVIGNLPYNISTPLLFHLVQYAGRIRDIHVMLQKEVVERMVAAPGDSNYGRLSVMLQYRFAMDKLLDVPGTAFDPVPRVDSAVVRLLPLRPLPCMARDEAQLAAVVAMAFSQRRKTLRNSLRKLVAETAFESLGIAPAARAQELSVAQFVALADYLTASKTTA